MNPALTPASERGRLSQRERIVAGIGRAIAEYGGVDVPLERLLVHAGASRQEFESHFATRERAILAAQNDFLERLWLEVTGASEEVGDWVARMRAGLAAGLAYLADNRGLARVFILEAAAAGLAVSERQFAGIDRLAALLRGGREGHPEAARLPELTERFLIGGLVSIVSGHLLAEDDRALEVLEPQLAELILVYYVGRAEAERVVRLDPFSSYSK